MWAVKNSLRRPANSSSGSRSSAVRASMHTPPMPARSLLLRGQNDRRVEDPPRQGADDRPHPVNEMIGQRPDRGRPGGDAQLPDGRAEPPRRVGAAPRQVIAEQDDG